MNAFISRSMLQHVSRSTSLKNVWSQQVCTKRTSRPVREFKQREPYDPDYLPALQPEIPQLPTIDIMMKSYDFVVLENFQSKAHALAETLSLDVIDGWAARAQSLKVTKLKPRSTIVQEEILLKLYERVLQLENVPTTKFSILLEALHAIAPPGVTCTVVRHTKDIDDDRYVPDPELKDLKEQLEEALVKK